MSADDRRDETTPPRAAVQTVRSATSQSAQVPQQQTAAHRAGMSGERHSIGLAQVGLFAGLDADGLRQLASALRRRTLSGGDVIFHRDDPGSVLYVIRAGRVKICVIGPEGQEIVLALLVPGDYFGELALLDGQPRSATAIALEPTELLALQRADFLRAVEQHPRIAVHVIQVLVHRLRQTDEMVEDLLFLDVHGRVAKKLLDLAGSHGVRTPEGIRIEMRLTQGELAAMVGASRESVNKVMGYFADKQLVSTDKHRVTILRLADLRRRAV
ncbi:MAG TPA: Crp/Fnr family transcriptional regulator [Ktedonobacterales bacterium]|nr:Crp/Fnr family transcriptional regulator [Ktedonobacterales bacterium]